MKSHELAHWLLAQPDGEVLLDTGQGRKPCRVKTAEWFTACLPKHDSLVVLQKEFDRWD